MTLPGRTLTSATLARIDGVVRTGYDTYTGQAWKYGISKQKLDRLLRAERDAGRLPLPRNRKGVKR